MRDEMDARIWADHHDQFSAFLDGAGRQLVSTLRAGGGRIPGQLLAVLGAFVVTTLTFSASII